VYHLSVGLTESDPRLLCDDHAARAPAILDALVRLVSILGSPAPYTTPILNALAQRNELHAIYLAGENRVNRFVDSWGVEPTFDHSAHWTRRLDVPSVDFHLELSIGVTRHLRKLDPDALLLVSWSPAVVEPLLWSRVSGCAAVMWSESTAFSGLLRGPVSGRIRGLLTRTFDAYVSNGTQAALYLEQFGAPSDRIVTSMLPAGHIPLTTARANGTTDGEVRFLFVGRLTAQKRPVELIDAFAVAQAELANASLTIVGAGELETDVRRAAERVPRVRYLGHREGDELSAIYSSADVLVLPALREVWGVVVNEALSHGLFVVATDEVGSAHDLLDENTGVVVPAHDLARLAPVLVDAAKTLDAGDEARRLRAATMAKCTPERFAADISEAAEIAVRVRRGRWRGSRRRASSS
jgi:glycosyltransferase involved in cell wall biosynthesis